MSNLQNMELNKATIEEFESIIAFYNDVTDRTPEMERFARWVKGLHPTHDGISAYIEEGSMYLYKENDAIVGAMAVTMYQGEELEQHRRSNKNDWYNCYLN